MLIMNKITKCKKFFFTFIKKNSLFFVKKLFCIKKKCNFGRLILKHSNY